MSEGSSMPAANRVLAEANRLAVLRPRFHPDAPLSPLAWVERLMLVEPIGVPPDAIHLFSRITDEELSTLCPPADDPPPLGEFVRRLTLVVNAVHARAGPMATAVITNGELPRGEEKDLPPETNPRDMVAAFCRNSGLTLESAVKFVNLLAEVQLRIPLSLGKVMTELGTLIIGAQVGRQPMQFGDNPASIEGAGEYVPKGNIEIMKCLRNGIFDTTIMPGQNLPAGLILAGRGKYVKGGILVDGKVIPIGENRQILEAALGEQITQTIASELNTSYVYSHTTEEDIRVAMLIASGSKFKKRDGFYEFDIEGRAKEISNALTTISKVPGHDARVRFWTHTRAAIMKFAAHIKDINPTFRVFALDGGSHQAVLTELTKPRYCPDDIRAQFVRLATQAEGYYTAIHLAIRAVSDAAMTKLAAEAPQSTEKGVATREAAAKAVDGHIKLSKAVPVHVSGKTVTEFTTAQLFAYAAPGQFAALTMIANIFIADSTPATARAAPNLAAGSVAAIVTASRKLIRSSMADKTSESDNARHYVSALCDEVIAGVHLWLLGNCTDIGLGLEELGNHAGAIDDLKRRALKGSDVGGAVGVEVYDNAKNYPVGRVLSKRLGISPADLDSHVSAYCVKSNPDDYPNSPSARHSVSPKDLAPGSGIGKSVICNFPLAAAVKNKDSGYSELDGQTVIVDKICKAGYESGTIFVKLTTEFDQRYVNSEVSAQSLILVHLARHYNTVSFAAGARIHNSYFWIVFSNRRPVPLADDAMRTNSMVALTYANWAAFLARFSIAVVLADLEKNTATIYGFAAPRRPNPLVLLHMYKTYGELPKDYVPPSTDLRNYNFGGKKKATTDSAIATDKEVYVPARVDFSDEQFEIAVRIEQGTLVPPPPSPPADHVDMKDVKGKDADE